MNRKAFVALWIASCCEGSPPQLRVGPYIDEIGRLAWACVSWPDGSRSIVDGLVVETARPVIWTEGQNRACQATYTVGEAGELCGQVGIVDFPGIGLRPLGSRQGPKPVFPRATAIPGSPS